jgi:DNA mismatch repair ATPase MutS
MFLDAATLHDLEIVPTPARRGTTLWSLIDRTKTRAGREALRKSLVVPHHTADEILNQQTAHQAIAARASFYRSILDRADPDAVEKYLNVNWQLPSAMGGLLWTRTWYRPYLQDVVNGQGRVRRMLAAATDLQRELSSTNAVVLKAIEAQIAALMATPETHELLRLATRVSAFGKREFDQLARDRGKALLTDLLGCLGTVEAMWSLSVATVEHGWSYPRPASRLAAAGLVHPFLVQNAIRNDLDLEQEVRVCFVTGPNMAGKSTFLKAVALATLLAHIGCGVPATAMEFPIVRSIFSSIDIADNLNAGESFYLAEVRRMRALALALANDGSVLAVVDEPFRGTNVHDAAEATIATISRLAAHPAALVFVASHVGEVVPSIMDDPRVRFFHFAADLTDDHLRFDFRLRTGVSLQRLGMTLLKQEGVLEILERRTATTRANMETAKRD